MFLIPIIYTVMVSYSVIFSLLTPNQYHIKESKAKIRAITIIVIPMMRNLLLIGTLDVVGKLITTWKISMIFSLLNISINNNIEKTIIAFANAGSISRKMMSNIIVLIMIGININTPNRFVLFHNENQAPTS